MCSKSQFLDQQKFQDKHEHTFFFLFQKQKVGPSVCKCVPHTPKLKLHIVPNVCLTWKDLTREMDETIWNRFDSKHSPQT
jgi:hypothetical protein